MKYKNRMYGVRTMIREYERKKTPKDNLRVLTFDFAIQRPSGQWSKAMKSLFIHSILSDIIVPEIFIVQNGVGDFAPMTVLDGKQRMTTVYDFVRGGFKLSKNTPDIQFETAVLDENGNAQFDENGQVITEFKTIKLGNKAFNKLPQEIQEKILDFEFSTVLIMDATTEELEMQMYRLNNGKSQTAVQKAIMMFGMDLGSAIKEVAANNFIYDRLIFTPTEKKNSVDMQIVINALTVLNDCKYSKLTKADDMTKIAESFKNNGWTQNQLDYCRDIFELLNDVLPSDEEMEIDKEIYKSKNIPILCMNVEKYSQLLDDGEITEEEYKNFLKYWVTEGFFKEEFQQWCDKSVSDKSHVDARIDVMERELLKFIGKEHLYIVPESVVVKTETAEEVKDIAEEIIATDFAPIAEIDNKLIARLGLTNTNDINRFNAEVLQTVSDFANGKTDDYTMDLFRDYFNELPSDKKREYMEEAEYFSTVVDEYLENIEPNSKFIMSDNLLCMIYQLKLNNIEDKSYIIWLKDFADRSENDDIFNGINREQTNSIMGRLSYMNSDLERFVDNNTTTVV